MKSVTELWDFYNIMKGSNQWSEAESSSHREAFYHGVFLVMQDIAHSIPEDQSSESTLLGISQMLVEKTEDVATCLGNP